LLATNQEPEVAIDEMLSIIPESQRSEIRKWIEAISPLSDFREKEMASLLSAYAGSDKEWDVAQVREVRDKLQKANLMSWGKEGGYVISEPIQVLMQYYLTKKHPDTWKELNDKVIQLYRELSKNYSQHAGFYNAKIEYHRGMLKGKK